MSWSAQGTSLTPDSIRKIEPPVFSNAEQESREQFEEARELAASLAESGVLGDSNKVFNVSLSGHGNDNHEKNTQWTNDWVSVSVNQA